MRLKKQGVNLNKQVYVVTDENGAIQQSLCDYCVEVNPYFPKMLREFNLKVTKRSLTEEEKAYIRNPFVGYRVSVCGF